MKTIAYAVVGIAFLLLGCQGQEQGAAEGAGSGAGATAQGGGTATISGAGATFPGPIYSRWAAAYRTETGNEINYTPIGSGGGIRQIQEKTVTFGATDMPLDSATLTEQGLLQFPTVIGGDVVVLNVPGIEPDTLVLSGDTLARIYLGEIDNWSDPAITGPNPGLAIPDLPIVVAHRSDGSGTTFIFADYLSKVNERWADEVGASTAINWPVGIGAQGNEGVAAIVSRTLGAIGYVEYAFASETGLAYTRMINHDGNTVSPSTESFMAAAAGADWNPDEGYGTILNNLPGENAWPMAGATFILIHKEPVNSAAAVEALRFFQWAYERGDELATGLHFVPLPAELTEEIETTWSQVEGWPG